MGNATHLRYTVHFSPYDTMVALSRVMGGYIEDGQLLENLFSQWGPFGVRDKKATGAYLRYDVKQND